VNLESEKKEERSIKRQARFKCEAHYYDYKQNRKPHSDLFCLYLQ